MDEQKNGVEHGIMPEDNDLPALPPEPEPPQNAAQQAITAAQLVEAQVAQAMGVVIRGILVSSPGIPNGFTMQKIAFASGKVLAMLLAGNPVEMTVKARADFRKAFDEGMSKVPVLQMGGNQMPQPGPDLRR